MAYFTNIIFYVDNTPTDRLWTCMLLTEIAKTDSMGALARAAPARGRFILVFSYMKGSFPMVMPWQVVR